MNIAEKLRKLREDKGISQNKLIEELEEKQNINVAISSIRNYENTKAPRIPQGDVLLALARYYDVTLEYLIDDNITAYKKENLDIGKVLGLSDKAIKNIAIIKETYFNKTFDDFISSSISLDLLSNICISQNVHSLNAKYIKHYFWEDVQLGTFRDSEYIFDACKFTVDVNEKDDIEFLKVLLDEFEIEIDNIYLLYKKDWFKNALYHGYDLINKNDYLKYKKKIKDFKINLREKEIDRNLYIEVINIVIACFYKINNLDEILELRVKKIIDEVLFDFGDD